MENIHFSPIFFGVSTECCIFANNNAAFDAAHTPQIGKVIDDALAWREKVE